jgi:hypothetical protein
MVDSWVERTVVLLDEKTVDRLELKMVVPLAHMLVVLWVDN